MTKNNEQILLDIRDTMKQMLNFAESSNWDQVTELDQQRNGLASAISNKEYTGNISLIDEIINLDKKILETTSSAKTEINKKVALVNRARSAHSKYQTIAEL